MTRTARVLIVDDDEELRVAFARVLAREGYDVQQAATAEDALVQVRAERPHAILLDLKMPMINGIGFLYRLRENPENEQISVGLITGERTLDPGTLEDLKDLSVQVWHKPLSLDDLRRVARTLLNRESSTNP